MICERCHAGQMQEFEKKVGPGAGASIKGRKCDRCSFVQLDDDGQIWSALGV
jgi:hypothetical protein